MNRPRSGTATPRGVRSRAAAVLLFVLVLAITVSPRLRLGGGGAQVIDIRLQDLLLVPILLFLLINRRHFSPLFRLWGWLMPVFFWLLLLSFALLLSFTYTDPTPMRRILFLGRGVEIFVIAAAVAGLYLRAGPTALQTTLRAFHIAAAANFAWVVYQFATGSNGTLIGGDVGDDIQSYGPKLIGEPSAFGTGTFFAFIAALGVAQLRARTGKPLPSVVLIAMGAAGAILAESRASILVIGFVVVLLLVVSRGRTIVNPVGAMFVVLAAAIVGLTVIPELEGRLSFEAVIGALGFRATEVWIPLLHALAANPFFGVGPGGLVPPLAIEGHNIAMRAFLDYGIVLGSMFLAFFVVVVVKAWKATRRSDQHDADHRTFSNLALIFTLAIFVAGLTQDALTAVTSSHLAMVAIGLFAAANARAELDAPKQTDLTALATRRSRARDHQERTLPTPGNQGSERGGVGMAADAGVR